MGDITFETKLDFGNFGGNKKLTFTSWNGNAPRYDIRDWYDDKAGKGITLDKDELKALYGLLIEMFEKTDLDSEITLIDDLPFGLDEPENEEVPEVEKENADVNAPLTLRIGDDEYVLEPIDEEADDKYPTEITNIFNKLDGMFKGFSTEKAYGKMPFADGDRLQYCVKKGKKEFGIKENDLKKLGVNWFITDKGNLYIYTL